jgi:hypothetical protein
MKTKIALALFALSVFLNQPSSAGQETFVKRLSLLDKFGGMEVPKEQILANPCDLALSPEGFIYILDSQDNNIKVFEKDGTFVKRIGRQGHGPGEFVRTWTLSVIKDKIYVTDTGNRRIQIFSGDGNFTESYRVPVEYGTGMTFDSKANLFLNTKGFRSPSLISVYDNQGNFVREFGSLEGDSIKYYDFTLIKKQIKEGKIPDSFKNDVLLIIDRSGDLFAVHRALNKLKKFTPDGKLLKETEIEAEEFKEIYKEFLKKNESELNPSIFWGLSYVNDLAVDKTGNLYLLLNTPSQMTVYVFSKEGRIMGKILGVEESIFRIGISEDNLLVALSQETQFIYRFQLPGQTN